jgi:hypothetical protein
LAEIIKIKEITENYFLNSTKKYIGVFLLQIPSLKCKILKIMVIIKYIYSILQNILEKNENFFLKIIIIFKKSVEIKKF